jgi:PBS lyase HEAT-like repeat.
MGIPVETPVDVLKRLGKSKDLMAAVCEVGYLKDRRAVDPLRELLILYGLEAWSDAPPTVHREAVLALGRIGDLRAMDAIVFAATHHFAEVLKDDAEDLLQRMDPFWVASDGARQALSWIEASDGKRSDLATHPIPLPISRLFGGT